MTRLAFHALSISALVSLAACEQGAGFLDTFADASANTAFDAAPGSSGVWRSIGGGPLANRSILDAIDTPSGTVLALSNPFDALALHSVRIDPQGVLTDVAFAVGTEKNVSHAKLAASTDGTLYMATFANAGEVGVHLYILENDQWRELDTAYLPDAYSPISLSPRDTGLFLGAMHVGGIPGLYNFDPDDQTWAVNNPSVTADAVNSVHVASSTSLIVATVNAGGETTSLYANIGNPWLTISADVTGLVTYFEMKATDTGAVIVESYPEAVIHNYQGTELTEIYRDDSGVRFQGLAARGTSAFTFEVQGQGATAFLEISPEGTTRLPAVVEGGAALGVPDSLTGETIEIVAGESSIRTIFESASGLEVFEFDASSL